MFKVWVFTVSISYIKVSFVGTGGFNSISKPWFSFRKFVNFFNRETCVKYS